MELNNWIMSASGSLIVILGLLFLMKRVAFSALDARHKQQTSERLKRRELDEATRLKAMLEKLISEVDQLMADYNQRQIKNQFRRERSRR